MSCVTAFSTPFSAPTVRRAKEADKTGSNSGSTARTLQNSLKSQLYSITRRVASDDDWAPTQVSSSSKDHPALSFAGSISIVTVSFVWDHHTRGASTPWARNHSAATTRSSSPG